MDVLEGRGNVALDVTTAGTTVAAMKKGLTVPVRMSGPFDKLAYDIGFGGMVAEAARAKVEEKVKEKVQEKSKDVLRGLFKR